ncbi:MAG: Bax inhibitor-1/YccA family protein [Burkholderiaceae bacterium]|nr:MAG: Bax inhibitor-1/YccA family protein [Burkholderiaceae bacterium]
MDNLQNSGTYGFGNSAGTGLDLASQRNRVLRNTYWLLALALIPMGLGGLIGTQLSFDFLRSSPILGVLGMMAVIYGLMFAVQANRNSGVGAALLLVFTGALGVMLGPLLQFALHLSNGGTLIAYAAVGTAVIFFTMAAIGTTTKRDLTGLGKFLTVGAVVLIVAMIANIFLHMPVLQLVIASLFMLFSALVILWQMNAIVTGGETNYISATLTLVVQIYNLFVSLLQILIALAGGSRD